MPRLILCGAVAGSLLGFAIASFSHDDTSQPNGGITLVESAESQEAAEPEAAGVEALEGSDRNLAQVWLIAFGAGAFFLLELLSPLGIFYQRAEASRSREPLPAPRIPVRRRGLRVPAS